MRDSIAKSNKLLCSPVNDTGIGFDHATVALARTLNIIVDIKYIRRV